MCPKYQSNQGVVMQATFKQKCHSTGIFMNFKMLNDSS